MSDNESTKLKTWTDKERLTFLFALVDSSGVKFNFAATPRPVGRSVIACQRMVERLKATLKDELEALMAGQPIEGGGTSKKTGAPRTPKSATKRKNKGQEDANGEEKASPTKRGRKKKAVTPDVVDNEEDFPVKNEVKEEDEDFAATV
ncbi:hypothetical protein GQ44DRAFT_725006 [Phaeosphaeriaceae sp. PMI808]|nr:hypothetical protein GQ44DRAFT_725006 [Phaeosphaeriaceae sp. PMI808]